jgi:hypothetical protein
MFSISADFDMKDVEAYLNSEVEAWFDELVEELREHGREFTKRARAKTKSADNSFGNITWNLRSSIGFCLVQRDKVVESYFPQIKGGTTGEKTGAKYAKGVAFETSHRKDDILLVLVAGEEYAIFVKTKGFDVIESSKAQFEAEITQLWQ